MAERLTIARPYAKAVFQLACEQQQLPAWSSILQRGATAVQDARVAPLLGSPHATPDQLAELIAGIAGDGGGATAGAAAKILAVVRPRVSGTPVNGIENVALASAEVAAFTTSDPLVVASDFAASSGSGRIVGE